MNSIEHCLGTQTKFVRSKTTRFAPLRQISATWDWKTVPNKPDIVGKSNNLHNYYLILAVPAVIFDIDRLQFRGDQADRQERKRQGSFRFTKTGF